MIPTWILEAGVFGDATKPLQDELDRQRFPYHLVRYATFAGGDYDFRGMPPPDEGCVILYGSHPMMRHIRSYHPQWVPGGWCNFENLDCSTYYSYFDRYLLNRRHVIMSGVEATLQEDMLYERFGAGGRVFIRPASVEKVFSGKTVAKGSFSAALAPARYNPDTMVVIAEPQTVSREWRLVIANEDIIAANQYSVNGYSSQGSDCPSRVSQYARRILNDVQWRPDPLFMLDVCETPDGLFLVELNSFSCSAHYAADLSLIVQEASAQARREWQLRRSGVLVPAIA